MHDRSSRRVTVRYGAPGGSDERFATLSLEVEGRKLRRCVTAAVFGIMRELRHRHPDLPSQSRQEIYLPPLLL
jgi:hypothetical protein